MQINLSFFSYPRSRIFRDNKKMTSVDDGKREKIKNIHRKNDENNANRAVVRYSYCRMRMRKIRDVRIRGATGEKKRWNELERKRKRERKL